MIYEQSLPQHFIEAARDDEYSQVQVSDSPDVYLLTDYEGDGRFMPYVFVKRQVKIPFVRADLEQEISDILSGLSNFSFEGIEYDRANSDRYAAGCHVLHLYEADF